MLDPFLDSCRPDRVLGLRDGGLVGRAFTDGYAVSVHDRA